MIDGRKQRGQEQELSKYGSLRRALVDTETIGKEDWEELQRNLEATIPVYDKVNRVATLGKSQNGGRW